MRARATNTVTTTLMPLAKTPANASGPAWRIPERTESEPTCSCVVPPGSNNSPPSDGVGPPGDRAMLPTSPSAAASRASRADGDSESPSTCECDGVSASDMVGVAPPQLRPHLDFAHRPSDPWWCRAEEGSERRDQFLQSMGPRQSRGIPLPH